MEDSSILDTENHNSPSEKDMSASSATGSSVNGGLVSADQSGENNIQTDELSSELKLHSEETSKKTFQEFAEQIRKLEIEGNKLRALSANNLGTFIDNGFNFENSFEFPKTSSSYLPGTSDISAEQKYISDLRVQLESQRRETDQLTKQLLTDSYSYRTSPSSSHSFSTRACNQQFQSQEKSGFSALPASQWSQVFNRKSFDYLPPSHLERSLKESQEQIIELRKKLHELSESSDQQKRHFRQTVEDLKSKLHETIHNRDAVLDLRQKESNSQELLINKLQSTLMQLQDHSKIQEEALMCTTKQLESVKRHNEMTEAALSQISSILLEREKGRSHTYFKSDLISGQNTSILVHTLERCLRDLDNDIGVKSMKLAELESELEIMKRKLSERERNISVDYQEMIATITAEHERNMSSVHEKLTNATKKISLLQSQLQQEEDAYVEKLKSKEKEIREMEHNLIELRTENMKNTASWQDKKQALESSLDQVQKELAVARAEKNELIQSYAVAESRLEDFQRLVTQLESDLDIERDRVQQQRHREEELRSQLMSLELQVSNKQGDIERLERMLDMVKQECSLQVLEQQNLLSNSEKLDREHYLDQIKYLSSQLSSVTEKYNKSTAELQLALKEAEKLKSDLEGLTRNNEKARSQVDLVLADKADLAILVKEKTDMFEKVLKDKDHYVRLAELRADDVSHLKTSLESMKVQLEEKEKILDTLRQQSSSIAQLMEIHTRASDSVREDKERLAVAASEKEVLLQEMRNSVESLGKQMKTQEQRIEKLEEENLGLNKTINQKNQEFDVLLEDKKNLEAELTQIKANVETLTSKKDALKKEIIKSKALHAKELNKLQTKLKECEQEKRMSVKALRSKDIIDNKAVRYADKIQKEMTVKRSEVDQLTSKLHRLEEKLETVTKEKSMVEKDKDSLKKSLAKSLVHSQELSNKLESTLAQNNDLLAKLAQMEKDIEQRSSTYQTKMETFEQEITKLKLKHQLDLKEVEGKARCKTGSSSAHHKNSSVPSSVWSSASAAKQKLVMSDSGEATDASDSDSLITRNPKFNFNTIKPKHSIEVGRELKSLLGEMKHLISADRIDREDSTTEFISRDRERKSRRDRMNERKSDKLSLLQPYDSCKVGHKVSGPDTNKLSPSRSLTDLSEGFSYRAWHPRSKSLTRHPSSSSLHQDLTHGTESIASMGGLSESMHFNHSKGSSKKMGVTNMLIPDTQELCRRLEEKIENLTKMGGNLIKENKDMADLINLQGEKINTVKLIEQIAW
ncbi:hypothetical protein Btru_031467 [Bulinus truncatus]|nr:hypothetical protein Btru_031467 [Bulinus truncatus]